MGIQSSRQYRQSNTGCEVVTSESTDAKSIPTISGAISDSLLCLIGSLFGCIDNWPEIIVQEMQMILRENSKIGLCKWMWCGVYLQLLFLYFTKKTKKVFLSIRSMVMVHTPITLQSQSLQRHMWAFKYTRVLLRTVVIRLKISRIVSIRWGIESNEKRRQI